MFPRSWKRRIEKTQSFDRVMRPKFEVVASQNEESKYEFKQTSGENYTEKEPEKKEKLETHCTIGELNSFFFSPCKFLISKKIT